MAKKVIFFVAVALVAPLASAVSRQEPSEAADILNDTITHKEMSHLLKDNSATTVRCIEQQSEKFLQFGKDISEKMIEAASVVRGESDFGTKAGRALATIGTAAFELSRRFCPLVGVSPPEALQLILNKADEVKTHAKSFGEAMKTLMAENPAAAEETMEKVKGIHEKAKTHSRTISEGIKSCMRLPQPQ